VLLLLLPLAAAGALLLLLLLLPTPAAAVELLPWQPPFAVLLLRMRPAAAVWPADGVTGLPAVLLLRLLLVPLLL
jgi:hypothetical protein